jgi:2'-5' RNA ligase
VNNSKQLFFIALLPPQEVQQFADRIKQHFAEVYNSRAALKSPPHITLQPPFQWELEDLPLLEAKLQEFARRRSPVPIGLDGYGAFQPRVIYINVLKTPELLTVQQELREELELSLQIVDRASKNRPFAPHLTVGFKDLTKPNFYKAWQEFRSQQLYFEFIVPQLTLLIHNGKRWDIKSQFFFGDRIESETHKDF